MAHVHETLSDSQQQAVRYLAERSKENAYFERQRVIDETGLTDDEYDRLIPFLEQQGTVEIIPVDDGVYAGDFSVGCGILDIVHQLDHPPPKDYPKQVETLFRSKWWLAPFFYVLRWVRIFK